MNTQKSLFELFVIGYVIIGIQISSCGISHKQINKHWKKDSFGCNGYRNSIVESHKSFNKYINYLNKQSLSSVMRNWGTPNEIRYYKNSNKELIYWISGLHCSSSLINCDSFKKNLKPDNYQVRMSDYPKVYVSVFVDSSGKFIIHGYSEIQE